MGLPRVDERAMTNEEERHAIVMTLFGVLPVNIQEKLEDFHKEGFLNIVIDNRTKLTGEEINGRKEISKVAKVINNKNHGLIAGALNKGIKHAIKLKADLITLLDQDSELEGSQIRILGESLSSSGSNCLIGPEIIDIWRKNGDLKKIRRQFRLKPTRMLISSGTTFRSIDWPALGPMNEEMGIDYVDHHWCFRASERGFRCLTNEAVELVQTFGEKHPNWLCHQLGMQLYSPERHYHALRNLLWLARQPSTPIVISIKETAKMLLKAPLWVLCEPQRAKNIQAIKGALLHPLPVKSGTSN